MSHQTVSGDTSQRLVKLNEIIIDTGITIVNSPKIEFNTPESKSSKTKIVNDFFKALKKSSINYGTNELDMVVNFYPKCEKTNTIKGRIKNIHARFDSLSKRIQKIPEKNPVSIDISFETLENQLKKEIEHVRVLKNEIDKIQNIINTSSTKYEELVAQARQNSDRLKSNIIKVKEYQKSYNLNDKFASAVSDDDFILLDGKPMKASTILEVTCVAIWYISKGDYDNAEKIINKLYENLSIAHHTTLRSKLKWPKLWEDFYKEQALLYVEC